MIGSSNLGLIAFVVFYGLDWVATVPPTVAITAQAFGRERVGVTFGWIFGAHQLGAAVAAWGAGAARTWFGDYQSAFVTAGLLSLLASGLVIRIARGGSDRAPAGPTPARSPCMRAVAACLAVARARRSPACRRLRASAARGDDTRRRMPSSTTAPRAVVVRLSEPADPVGDGISVTGPTAQRSPDGRVAVDGSDAHARDRRA